MSKSSSLIVVTAKLMLLFTFLIPAPTNGAMLSVGEEDVLFQISQLMTKIDERLKEHRVQVSPAKVEWPQMERFEAEIMFVVSHDPHREVGSDIPPELNPSFLTQKLKLTWNELELSVLNLGEISKHEEWVALSWEMQTFFQQREEYLYQPARQFIKNGTLSSRLLKLKELATQLLSNENPDRELSVRILDPFIEKLANEMAVMNNSVLQLKELRTPPPVIKKTIYDKDHYQELVILTSLAFGAGLILSLLFVGIRMSFKKKEIKLEPAGTEEPFNYYDWLKRLELSLQLLRKNDDNFQEDMIRLKEMTGEMAQARMRLNEAGTQEEFYNCLDLLNSSAPKIEEWVERLNVRQNSEVSRKLVLLVVQLCDAIEMKKDISLQDEKPEVKVLKQERIKAA